MKCKLRCDKCKPFTFHPSEGLIRLHNCKEKITVTYISSSARSGGSESPDYPPSSLSSSSTSSSSSVPTGSIFSSFHSDFEQRIGYNSPEATGIGRKEYKEGRGRDAGGGGGDQTE